MNPKPLDSLKNLTVPLLIVDIYYFNVLQR